MDGGGPNMVGLRTGQSPLPSKRGPKSLESGFLNVGPWIAIFMHRDVQVKIDPESSVIY